MSVGLQWNLKCPMTRKKKTAKCGQINVHLSVFDVFAKGSKLWLRHDSFTVLGVMLIDFAFYRKNYKQSCFNRFYEIINLNKLNYLQL